MSASGFDPAILQDFLTECGELLEQLDQDLVVLEQSPDDPELLNQVFRALHTIKGSASFLTLTNLVRIAHAAESALNAARNRVVTVDRAMMDLLLQAVDTVKSQFADLQDGRDLTEPDARLVKVLTDIGDGKPTGAKPSAPAAPAASPVDPRPATAPTAVPQETGETAVVLAEGKSELLDFMVADLERTLGDLRAQIASGGNPDTIVDWAAQLERATSFFGIDPLSELIALLGAAAARLSRGDASAKSSLETVVELLGREATALKSGRVKSFDLAGLRSSLGGAAGADPVEVRSGGRRASLRLPENKADLIGLLVTDLNESLAQVASRVESMSGAAGRANAADELCELAAALTKSAEFFEFESMGRLAALLSKVGAGVTALPDELLGQVLPRAAAAVMLMKEQAEALTRNETLSPPIDALCASVEQVLTQQRAVEGAVLPEGATTDVVLKIDGVASEVDVGVEPEPGAVQDGIALTIGAPEATASPAADHASPAKGDKADAAKGEDAKGAAAVEQTIRVEVGRLESLLNLVGELVLQKNRLAAIARNANAQGIATQEFRENLTQSMGTMERVTSDIQVAVMRTRMQPLDKLFGRYPRLIRDLARKTNKQIRLDIEGGETEVDKSVIEELGDPLVHLLRNSADHGIEPPAERAKAGKAELGVIRLIASHEGNHVLVRIVDDGRGLSRERIGRKAVEKGLTTAEQVAQMSDRDVWNFIFAAGFSTADQVSDLSGRGVGMDVVRTNIEKLKGTVELDSVPGNGTTISIKIPLTVAIMSAMLVQVAHETYAVPLSNVLEIVKPEPQTLSTIHGRPVMRLRDTVLPLLDSGEVFEVSPDKRQESPFALVLASGEKRVGLMVTRLIGQQEIVIKPLDGMIGRAGPVSGATVRDDGGVSLIVDVARMVKMAEDNRAAMAG